MSSGIGGGYRMSILFYENRRSCVRGWLSRVCVLGTGLVAFHEGELISES